MPAAPPPLPCVLRRPCPIGLSVARVIAVEGRTLVLGGADVVDGTPVLDVKPYAPFSDALPEASAPGWVAARAVGGGGEPLELAGVEVPAAADAALAAAWEARAACAGGSLYASYAAYRQLVLEVLARDVRSVTQRVKVPARAAAGFGSLALAGGGGDGGGAAATKQQAAAAADYDSKSSETLLPEGYWHVELDGIDISYEVLDGSMVQLCMARLVAGNS